MLVGSIRRWVIGMAKYSSTSMDFFYRLTLKEGMMYLFDIEGMAREEREAMESSVKPVDRSLQGFDPRSMFVPTQQWKNF